MSDHLLPHPATGELSPRRCRRAPAGPATRPPQETPVARTPAQVRRLAGDVGLDELDARVQCLPRVPAAGPLA